MDDPRPGSAGRSTVSTGGRRNGRSPAVSVPSPCGMMDGIACPAKQTFRPNWPGNRSTV